MADIPRFHGPEQMLLSFCDSAAPATCVYMSRSLIAFRRRPTAPHAECLKMAAIYPVKALARVVAAEPEARRPRGALAGAKAAAQDKMARMTEVLNIFSDDDFQNDQKCLDQKKKERGGLRMGGTLKCGPTLKPQHRFGHELMP
jgi:hypothetical protein